MTDRPVCPECKRPMPREAGESESGPVRKRFILLVPPGEDGLLDHLLEDIVTKYQEVWPDLISPVSEQGWRYKATAFAFQAVIDANLVPSESGA